MGLSGMLEEFAQNIFTELDFRNEAYHARLLSHNMRDVPEVRVPAVYEAHSTATVLTMEYIQGIKITEIARRARMSPLTGPSWPERFFDP